LLPLVIGNFSRRSGACRAQNTTRTSLSRSQDVGPEEGLTHRLEEIEESLLALARYLDKAFAELRGEETEADPL
jgi:hypothetical protein